MTALSFSEAQDQFDEWARHSLFDVTHREAFELLETAVDIELISLYRELDLHKLLAEHDNAIALNQALGFEASAAVMLEGVLARLAQHDFLDISGELPEGERPSLGDSATLEGDCSGTRWNRYTPRQEPASRDAEKPAIAAAMQALGADYPATLEFLAFGREHFKTSLGSDHEFMDRVLTGQEKSHAETWDRATNTDPLQDIHGIMGAKAVALLFGGGRILEVGGGTGNGLRNNLQALDQADKLEQLECYQFTDVSMPFILNTKRALAADWPSVKIDWRLLNINKDFAAQRLEAGSVDMVYGVNAAHIAMRMVEFLDACQWLLKPGGRIVFSERLRPESLLMAPREIVLNQSRYHRTAANRHPDYRPAHAYLSRQHWINAFEQAGFSSVAVWPDTASLADYFPEQYAAVIVAEKR